MIANGQLILCAEINKTIKDLNPDFLKEIFALKEQNI